jgi:biopolymer transport protein ExbB
MPDRGLSHYIALACALVAWLGLVMFETTPPGSRTVIAQETTTDVSAPPVTEVASDAAAPDAAAAANVSDAPAAPVTKIRDDDGLNFFVLMVKGGWLMIPIGLMSLMVVVVAIERSISLRRSRVLPSLLVKELGGLGESQSTFDPREAYRICQRYPSAAANVVKAMLLKVGRPHSEVEHTVAEASEREAERLYSLVRWLNLATTVTPMLGLLGTVWGMIDCFHRTTLLAPGQNKAAELATGIYIALVTTYGGLLVAIPASILAHFFEGRIQKLFHQIDEMLYNLLPQIERFEGRVRFGRSTGEGQIAPGLAEAEPPPLAQPPIYD